MTNGVANSLASAQSYRREDESAVRAVAQSRPPLLFSHSIWLAKSSRVASAGVLYVWSLELLSTAMGSDRKSGVQRPESLISATRSSAAGLISAIHSPPSAAKHFCGAK